MKVYVDASPDLWSFHVQNTDHCARTSASQQRDLDAALLAATEQATPVKTFCSRRGRIFARAARRSGAHRFAAGHPDPELVLHSPQLDAAPKVADAVGGNGYSLAAAERFLRAQSLCLSGQSAAGEYTVDPRADRAAGEAITRELRPAPYLVMDAEQPRTTSAQPADVH